MTQSSSILSKLNPIQQQAVTTTEGPVLVLAGAGSGKTRVLTHKVAYLISEKKVAPHNILMVTFTNKAADEMRNRVVNLLGSSEDELPLMGTFHSFCAKLLRIEGEVLGLSKNFVIYDTSDSERAIKMAMDKLGVSTKNYKVGAVLSYISNAKNELLAPNEYKNFARGYFAEAVSRIYVEYQKILKTNNALDFDDLLFKSVDLLKKNLQIQERISKRYKYVLVDEYQDVNHTQYVLTKLLSSYWGNLTVVGDASQAIYGFRGADFRNILNFQNDFPQAQVFNLEENYRSSQNILDAAYAVIAKNTSHPILKLWTKNSEGQKLILAETSNEVAEANFIVKVIKESLYPFSDFAILYRTNAQSRALEEAFLHERVSYRLVGGLRFYERKEIKDILAHLRVIANPKDTVALNRIEKLGKTRLKKFLAATLDIDSTSKPIDLIESVLDKTDYLLLIDDGSDQGATRVENVKELKSVASGFENLDLFLENVALMESGYTPSGRLKSDEGPKVTLMTVHAAKGLEFPVVFLVGMEEGLFPHSRSLMEPDQLEEERRLAYVAITRAKEKLYMTYTRERLYFGARTSSVISRFVIDIPQNLLLPLGGLNLPERPEYLDNY